MVESFAMCFNAATREPAWRPSVWTPGGLSWSESLQCGHAGTRVETRASAGGPWPWFMELQCGHAGTRVETGGGNHLGPPLFHASMRPRGNPRGDRKIRRACPSVVRCFNAATREPAWRQRKRKRSRRRHSRLQCGHAGTRVETVRLSGGEVVTYWLQCGHAGTRVETSRRSGGASSRTRLQCGHAGTRVETRERIGDGRIVRDVLQCGHAGTRVETLDLSASRRLTGRLQCGHAGTRVETAAPLTLSPARWTRFNAATREPAWRPGMVWAIVPLTSMLQCGHAGTRVETPRVGNACRPRI